MVLPANFRYSQASLQDYTDCPRRFQLRYVLDIRWPAAHQGPVLEWERRARRGAAFHRLIHQHITGIPAEALDTAARESGLWDWWQAYLTRPPRDLPASVHRPELRLSTPLGNYRLGARYDLLALEPGELVDTLTAVDDAYRLLWDDFAGTPAQFDRYRQLDQARLAALQGRLSAAREFLPALESPQDEQ